MTVDPLRLSIALVPVAAYLLLLAVVNARRRPFVTSGSCDLTALGVALSGLLLVGPIELLRPEGATREFGDYIWLVLLLFYWLWLLLAVLLSRPRLVVYNMGMEQLHAVLAETASRLDSAARWAGNQLILPTLGVQLHLDSFDLMRNVSLIASGGRQNIDGWRQLARELRKMLSTVKVRRNPRAIGLAIVSLGLLALSVMQLVNNPQETLQAMSDVLAY
jgi:hypothetical protein